MNEHTALILQKRIERFYDADPVPADEWKAMLEALNKPFPASAVGKLPKISCGACRDAPSKACATHRKGRCETCGNWITSAHVHLDYVGHAHLTERLLSVDPEWDWLPMSFNDAGEPDTSGGRMWIVLRVGGRFFQGVGDADGKKGTNAVKEIIGDALRNVGMRRGIALQLWMKERDVPEEEGEEAPTSAPAARKAAPTKAAAKKAPSTRPAKKAPAAPPTGDLPEGVTQEDIDELTAALAALEDPEQAHTFIKGRGVNPDTWEGLTAGKVRAIRSAIKNMATVQEHGNPPLSKPPASPPSPKPPSPKPPSAPSPRAAVAELVEGLPEVWQKVMVAEIATAAPDVNLAGLSTAETVMQAPAGEEWTDWLVQWVTDAEAALEKDPAAVPSGGEPY